MPGENADEIRGARKSAGPSDFGYIVFGPLEQVASEVDSLARDPGIERDASFRTKPACQMVRRATDPRRK